MYLCLSCNATIQSNTAEARIIDECLTSFGGLTPESTERLQRYKEWSDVYEEIPCFTNCYISKMYDIYNETNGFNRENVIRKFNEPVYNACKQHMATGRDSCEIAYNGFHCLVKLENDPLVYIDTATQLSAAAKTAMKECLRKFNDYEWQHTKDYAKFPVREPLPCYTKCFINKLQLYDARLKRWKIDDMRTHLSVPMDSAYIRNCEALSKRRTRNSCAWMYQEFTCFVMAK